MKCYVENILVPFFIHKREALGLEETYTALVLFDRLRGQNTTEFLELLEAHNIHFVKIPPNTTDKLQPLDILVNKTTKDEMKKWFQEWYMQKRSRNKE